MAEGPDARQYWAVKASAEYRARPGPHGPEEVLWSVRRNEASLSLDGALDVLVDLAEQIAAADRRVSGTIELSHQGARLLYVPLGARDVTQVSPQAAVERLEAIHDAAETLFAPIEAGPSQFRRRPAS